MTQRPVSRLVIRRMRSPLPDSRQQSAPTCRLGGRAPLALPAALERRGLDVLRVALAAAALRVSCCASCPV
jgi:hypothetical protein